MNILFFLPVAVFVVGIYFLVGLEFFIFKPTLLKDISRLLKKRGVFGNLCLALSGTLGVGNIVGVAIGLIVGGAGSVFWIVISSVFAALIKYSESSLSVFESSEFGIISVIKTSFSRMGEKLAATYAVFVLALSVTMGAGLQCASFSEVFSELFNTPPVIFGILMLIPAALIMIFGTRGIKDASAIFVSTASIIYTLTALIVIFLERNELPRVFEQIFKEAFNLRAAGGGFSVAAISICIREGFCRGILSNEAGLGTSALAHSTDVGYSSHEAGLVGVLEVFFDTAFLCPLSAVMLLCAGDKNSGSPISYVLSAVSRGGVVFEYLFAFSVFCFAFSTVICWIFYAKSTYSYLFRKKWLPFALIFLVSLPVGAYLGSSLLVKAVDYIMLPLAIISMLTVMKNSDKVKRLYRSRNI